MGYYHLIHFDLHGAVMSYAELAGLGAVSPHSYRVRLQDRFARPDLAPPARDQTVAYLFFEDETSDNLDPASAGDGACGSAGLVEAWRPSQPAYRVRQANTMYGEVRFARSKQ